LPWGVNALAFGLFLSFLITLPGLIHLPDKRRGIFLVVWGFVSYYLSYLLTDSIGSAWCFVNTATAIFYLIDYMFFGPTGDDEAFKAAAQAKGK
jgi:hypothetical protein